MLLAQTQATATIEGFTIKNNHPESMDAIELSLFSNRINAVCEEMGARLRAAAFSPNIRDRLDFSCAVFDETGGLCAQAAHIPVHLGSMAFAMRQVIVERTWSAGELVLFNDPFKGGTHLPDLTLIMPVFIENELIGFVANRAHHADIGAEQPGSMPISSHIDQEGLLISPSLVGKQGRLNRELFNNIFHTIQNPEMSFADLSAQASANLCGLERLQQLIGAMGIASYRQGIDELNAYGERMMRTILGDMPPGTVQYADVLDDDGHGQNNLPIVVSLCASSLQIEIDFTGTCAQVSGNVNCPLSVTAAAVYYVFRCLFNEPVPLCAGTFRPLLIKVPDGCLLNARYPAAVAAGNVETSSRIVDVLFGALAQILPGRIPACSQGTMNNLAMGQAGADGWSYYETIAGGVGANSAGTGADAVQTHMTNTQNTPIEVLEMHYPIHIQRYAIRSNSGGVGKFPGSNGVIREYQFLADNIRFTILSERRTTRPCGASGGEAGQPGRNLFNGEMLPGKVSMIAKRGDVLTIETPGGGAYGNKK